MANAAGSGLSQAVVIGEMGLRPQSWSSSGMGSPRKSPEKEDVNGDGSMLIFARPGGNPDGRPDGIADLRLADMSKRERERSFREESYVPSKNMERESKRAH